jgi:Transglycosylase SLT domain
VFLRDENASFQIVPASKGRPVKSFGLTNRTDVWSRIAGALTGAGFMTVLAAFCGATAHAEDAGEAVRTSAHFGKANSPGAYDIICRTMVRSASDNNLPVEFFTRVIWQESKFNVAARSSVGAQGIAQFMPSTASSRGLVDPFDPVESLRQSASYLRELRNKFGSLGLAAAAYNAGPGRVARWLSGKIHLPAQTVAYVRLVTGRSVADWTSTQPSSSEGSGIPKGVPCTALASLNADQSSSQNESIGRKLAAWAPWGVQLVGDWTQDQVLARYDNLRRKYPTVLGDKDPLVVITYGPSGRTKRYLGRVAENTEEEAEQLCKRLQALGGSCFAIRNRE